MEIKEKKGYTSVFINGELYLLNYEVVLKDYLSYLNVSESNISSNIFECNNKIISKNDLKKIKLGNLTKLELVQVVGGG
uniref:Thiamine biosynthesis protein n=1 Tax=Eustigmatophyceae sp. Chic 10/23 P-6w TaxID=1446905 RepID=A0A3R5QM16_9STRA|nr:Thiamine biosynthesis protein [Eustigmatophyceae sp. Chic 10/23 P-6w]QAA11563.1 Thiamine biosynthesis protein [Eustigmatophyceae sp. Chic 10/23 P-6w]